jgi:hypothetical protein
MPGLVPDIHAFLQFEAKNVDGRDKPGHGDAIFFRHFVVFRFPRSS